MAGIEETLLNEYDNIFLVLLEKVDDYNKAKAEYTDINNRLKNLRDELEFVTTEHDIAENEGLGDHQILMFEARMEDVLTAIQDLKRELLPKLKAVKEAHEALKFVDQDFSKAEKDVMAKHKDSRLLKDADEVRFVNNSFFEAPGKKFTASKVY